MSVDDAKLLAVGVLWLLSLVVVGVAGYMMRDSLSAPEDVSYRPEVIQGDGSVVLERVPDLAPSPAPHQLPKGAIEERRVTVTVQPDAAKPVKLDLSLVRVDGGRRVVASSEGGLIVGGMDVPIVPTEIPVERRWAAGGGYDPVNDAIKARVDYDWQPRVRLSVDAGLGDYDGDGLRREPSATAWVLVMF